MSSESGNQTPSFKLQAPEKLQISSNKQDFSRDTIRLEVGAWDFLGAWDLGFGISLKLEV
jgi:hypothetical protein